MTFSRDRRARRRPSLPACLTAILALAVAASVAGAPKDARATVSIEDLERVARFELGGSLFALHRALADALIDQVGIETDKPRPVAADELAVLTLLPERADPMLDPLVTAAAIGWRQTSALLARRPGHHLPFWQRHDIDRDRTVRLACLIVGAGPDRFAAVGDAFTMPVAVRETCAREFVGVATRWIARLQPFLRDGDDDTPRLPALLEPAETETTRGTRELLDSSGLVRIVAEDAARTFDWPLRPVLRGQDCTRADAYWSPDTGAVVLCYELPAFFRALATRPPLAR